jgi:hypothetical protein
MAASSDEIVPLFQRSAHDLFLRLELAQAGLDDGQLRFALLDELGRFHQPRVDALALGLDFLQVTLQLLGAALGRLELVAVALEPLARLVRVEAALRGGERRTGNGEAHCKPGAGKHSQFAGHVPDRSSS